MGRNRGVFLLMGVMKSLERRKSFDIAQYYLANVSQIDGKFSGMKLCSLEISKSEQRTTWRIRFSEGVVTLTAKGRKIGASSPELNGIFRLNYTNLNLDDLSSEKDSAPLDW